MNDQRTAILLATYNGAAHLDEQLESLACQDHPVIDVYASDDRSSDGTLDILRRHADRWRKGRFEIIRREAGNAGSPHTGTSKFSHGLSGSNANFMSLVRNTQIDAAWYAFCDQDDIWRPSKLSKAIAWLEHQPAAVPAMHCSRTLIIEEGGKPLRPSLRFARPPSFQNAIIQNIAAGNTIVMNHAAIEALRQHTRDGAFVSHDWWAYQLVTALGGKVHYDATPLTLYRQHQRNLIGENASWRARMTRLRMVMANRFRDWNETNLRGLSLIRHLMPPENRRVLDDLVALHEAGLLRRPLLLAQSGIHRQTILGQVSLFLAAIMDKV
ncbi:MAG: glycosyltransferase [Nitratireductor sp.]|nr:glycosyltransferase [Nitratireductor sp.]